MKTNTTTHTYYIKEQQDLNVLCTESTVFTGTLTQAKRFATRNKFYQGTALIIESSKGCEVCHKECGKKWVDTYNLFV